jgi:hypothetical protein
VGTTIDPRSTGHTPVPPAGIAFGVIALRLSLQPTELPQEVLVVEALGLQQSRNNHPPFTSDVPKAVG